MRIRISLHTGAVSGLLCLAVMPELLPAQPISVPNYSFEQQTAPGTYPYVNINVDEWQKAPEPAYYTPTFGGYGIPWAGTAGVFLDVNPYVNHVGNQCGYILALPQATLFQDYTSTPTHDFNATYEVGKSYTLTVGVFGKDTIAPGSTFQLSLYYLDGLGNHVVAGPTGSTTITYSAATFPTTTPLSLVDFSATVPPVQASDAWAGQHIGIQLESTIPIALTSFGNWDFDNVRLSANVPEPAAVSLLGLGVGGWLLRRTRVRK